MIVAFLAAALSLAGLNLPTQDLAGQPRIFPADIAPVRAVIVLTFSKSASDEASEWTRKLRENQQKLGAGLYQIAVLEDVPALFRSFVISSIRRAVPKNLHHNFWVAASASSEWQKHTGSNSPDQAHVFLLEGRSVITWRVDGVFSEAALRSLFAALAVDKK